MVKKHNIYHSQISEKDIKIDYQRDTLLDDHSLVLLRKYYCRKEDKSPQNAFARAAACYSGGDKALAQRIYNYVSKGWFMFASPLLSNAAKPGERIKSLPISCFLSYVPDSLEGLIDHTAELRWLSVKGGGVGGHWSSVRAVSDMAPGPIPFLKTVDADMTAYRQGRTRKGSYAAYLDVSHPDIWEFIGLRIPTGGDVNRKCLNLHHAVNISDSFMRAVEQNDDWDLICPFSKEVRKTMAARKIWQYLLETRYRTGEPYLNFIDTANKALPTSQKEKDLIIRGSNLCNEIHLPTSHNRTAVCCLSSVNLEKFDEWEKTPMVQDLIEMLDNTLQYFIDFSSDEIQKARFSATQERSLGLGALGFHAYLHQKRVAFDSATAKAINKHLFKHIQSEAVKATIRIGKEKGEAPDMVQTGRRNAHLIAIAPNANSSILANTTPSIEPIRANAYTHKTRVGSHMIRNKYLKEELAKIKKDNEAVWTSITVNGGSVQHLEFLSDDLKKVFKTATELDQRWVIDLAADRQKYICQGQSLNVFFASGASKSYVHAVHYQAWKKGCKGLYYLRTETSNRAETVSGAAFINKKLQSDFNKIKASDSDCLACEG